MRKSILLIIIGLFILIGTSSCLTAISIKSVQKKNRLLVSQAWGNIFETIDYQNGHNFAFVRIYDVNFEEKEYGFTLTHLKFGKGHQKEVSS